MDSTSYRQVTSFQNDKTWIVALYKVAGQRRVVGIIDAESHDELDQMIMAGMPIAHNLEWEEIWPVREYENFASDVKRRWKPEEKL